MFTFNFFSLLVTKKLVCSLLFIASMVDLRSDDRIKIT